MTVLHVKEDLLEYYISEDKLDIQISNRMLWTYIRILVLFHQLRKHHELRLCRLAFEELFAEKLIFVPEEKEVQLILDNRLLQDITTTLDLLAISQRHRLVSYIEEGKESEGATGSEGATDSEGATGSEEATDSEGAATKSESSLWKQIERCLNL